MNIVTLWLKVMKICQKGCKIVKNVQKWLKVCNSGKKWEKVVKWANRNWTRFYKELLSQSFEVLQMWPRHTARLWDCHSLYSSHAISMTFQWNSMASRWNYVECHGIPWDTEDRIILTMEIHGIWDSDKISEWKHWSAMK